MRRATPISKEILLLVVAKIVNIHSNLTASAHVEVWMAAHVWQVINRKLRRLESRRMSEGYQHMGTVVKLMTMY